MADITTFKILINSTVSTEDIAMMMMMDIKNYCLGTLLPRFKYMKMLLSRFPDEIVQKYNLKALSIDGWVLNYSHSRNTPCAPARTHGQIQAPREPPN
jgi:hypothetical protein